MSFNSYDLKHRPDQVCYDLNNMLLALSDLKNSIRVVSQDKKQIIIIGNQPIDPSTGKPYSFGIHTYKILGDKLEEI